MADLSRLNNIRQGKLFRLWDIPVFAVIVALTCSLLLVAFFQPKGSAVRVTRGGEEIVLLSLSDDSTTDITDEDGNHLLTLIVKDKTAYVIEAVCPDHVCMRTGAISRVHQSIVCLPAKIVVKVIGESEVDGIGGGA